MSITASGVARIRHAGTGIVYDIDPEDLDWNQVAADERQMGMEVAHAATIVHPELGDLTWTLWEYPLGMENDRETDVGPHDLVRNFELTLTDPDGGAFDRGTRVEAMVDWFLARFEDPAQSTPHDSGEGGYLYIWGGPYDAREQISENFPDEDESLIGLAVARVERDGVIDWAPVNAREDFDSEPPAPEDADEGDPDEALPAGAGELEALLQSIPAVTGPVFEADDDGRIELARWTPTASPDPALVDALRQHAGTLAALLAGTNAHTDLAAAIAQYAEALTDDPPAITRLYVEGVHLETVAAEVEAGVAADDGPPLPAGSTAALNSLRQLHGALIMADPEGVVWVERAAAYQRTPEVQAALTGALTDLTQAVSEATELFGPKAREVITRLSAQAGQGPQPGRSNQVAITGLGSLLAVAALHLGAHAFETIVGGGLMATQAAVALQQGVTAGANAFGSFFLAHLEPLRVFAAVAGPELYWLGRLADWIRRRQSAGPPP